MKAKSGFTLVEILIVVVILGILAAIVIPQFTGASTEAKESALRSDLQAIRSQIELYKIQHNADILPGEVLQADGTVTAATDVSFVNAMTCKTDKNGVADTDGTGDPAVYRFGPYMKKIPGNPFSTAEAIVVAGKSEGDSSVSVGTLLAAGGTNAGWNFVNDATGLDRGHFQAADPLADPLDDTNLHVNY